MQFEQKSEIRCQFANSYWINTANPLNSNIPFWIRSK